MGTEIIKFKQLYKVIFKDLTEPKLITPEIFKIIAEDLKNNRWINLDDELYNPYEVKKIVKYRVQDGITRILNKENELIQVKVRDYMRYYRKQLTIGVVENMIKKAKGIDI